MPASENKRSSSVNLAIILRILISLLIPILIILISFFAGEFAPFGNKDVLNAGKSTDGILYYYEMYDHFKSPDSGTYSNSIGLIHDYISDYLYHLSDPTNLIILLFKRESIPTVLNILYMIKIALCSCFFSMFLSSRKINDDSEDSDSEKNTKSKSKTKIKEAESDADDTADKTDKADKKEQKAKTDIILGGAYNPRTKFGKFILSLDLINIALSISFALSQFFLSEGLNVTYLSSIAILPLIIWGIDDLIKGKSAKKLIITLTLSFYFSVYISIINLILISVYFFIQIPVKRDTFFSTTKKYVLSVISALLLSSAVLFPVMSNSSFKQDFSLSFIRFRTLGNPLNVISQMMFKSRIAYLAIYDNGINIYFGIFGIILLICYFVNSKTALSVRIKFLFFILFMFSGTLLSTTNYLLNGFRGYTDNTINYGYFFIFIVLLLAHDGIQNVRHISKPMLTILTSLFAILVLATMKFAENLDSIKPLYYSLEILLAYYLIILIFSDKSMSKVLFAILTSLICIGEVGLTYTINLTALGTTAYVRPTNDSEYYKTYQAADYIHKNYDKDASILSIDTNNYDTNPFLTSLLGFDYLITSELNTNIEDLYTFKATTTDADAVINKSIYSNDNTINSTIFDSNISTYEYNPSYPFMSANILTSDYLKGTDTFKIIDGNTTESEVYNKYAANFSFSAYDEGDVYARAYSTVHIGSDSENAPVDSYQPGPLDRYSDYTYQYAVFNKDNLLSNINLMTDKTGNEKILPNKEYSINSSEGGYLYVPALNCANLVAKVNGNKVKTNSFVYNTTLIPLTSGTNKVEYYYSYNILITGIVVSIITLIILLCALKIKNKKKLLGKAADKVSGFICDNKTYFMTILIITAVFIFCQMITGSYPFGTKSTVMDDGLSQGITVFWERIKTIKNNNPIVYISQNIGLNREIYSYNTLTSIMHPWQLLILKFIPDSMVLFYFTLIYYIIFILNSISIIFYMTHREFNRIDKKNSILILIGVVYGLSSYAIVMFSYQCFRLLIYIPLIMLGMEKIIYHEKKLLYIISLALMMIYDHYYAFLLCEILVLAFLTYKFDDFKHFIKAGISFALSSIAAAGLSAFKLLTYFNNTATSGYVEADKRVPELTKFFTPFTSLFSTYHPVSYLKAISDDNSKAAIYVGICILLILPLYALNKKTALSTRVKNLILLIIIYLAFNNEVLNYIFHGFHYQSLAPNRFAAFFVFMLICMIADTLLSINEYSFKHIIPTVLAANLIYAVLHIINKDFRDFGVIIGAVLLLSCLIVVIVLAIKNIKNKVDKRRFRSFVMAVMMVDSIINGIFLLSNNIGSDSKIIYDANNINKATAVYSELTEPFVGSAFLDNISNNYNIACMTDIQSPAFFYSGATTNTLNMYTKYNLQHELNVAYYSTGNPLADMMMHTKYHISDKNIDSRLSWYPIKGNVNNIEIRENPYFLPLGFMIDSKYTGKLDEWDNLSKTYANLFEYQNDFSAAFDNNKLYEIIDIKESSEELKDKSYYTIDTIIDNSNMQNSDFEVPVNMHLDSSDMKPGYYYVSILGRYNFLMYFTEITDTDRNLTISVPSDKMPDINTIKASFCIARLNTDALAYIHNALDDYTLQNVETNGRKIKADINSGIDGKLYISLPYDNNYEILLDNKEIKAKPYLGGIGIDITAGQHSIELRYHPAGAYEGFIITLSTVFILILAAYYKRKKAISSPNKESDDSNESIENES